jgi:drug/metabolite transporter (DMT)-like permease
MSNKEQKKQGQKPEQEKFTLKDYFYINIIFLFFLFIISLIVFFTAGGKWDPVIESAIGFIFIVFGGGFAAVSVFDYLYERYAGKDENQNQ